MVLNIFRVVQLLFTILFLKHFHPSKKKYCNHLQSLSIPTSDVNEYSLVSVFVHVPFRDILYKWDCTVCVCVCVCVFGCFH